MERSEVRVGIRVRNRIGFSGLPQGTEGVIDEDYGTGIMVAWDRPEAALPEGYRAYDGRPAVASGLLRDGFAWDELKYLETVPARGYLGKEVLTLDAYQEQAAATALYPGATEIIMEVTLGADISEASQDLLGLVYLALGLAGEAGEFANKVKKILRDHNGRITEEMREDLLDELGDNQWYLSQAARHLNCPLSTVAAMNLAKLQERRRTGKITGSGDKR